MNAQIVVGVSRFQVATGTPRHGGRTVVTKANETACGPLE